MKPFTEAPLSISGGPHRLQGLLGRPGEADDPAERGVVFVHGWGGYRIGPHRILVRTARALAQHGFATLRFDLRGRGDSDGNATEADLDGMIEETCSAASALRYETGCRRIELLGICSGANVAIGAATLDENIHELVLWSALPFQPDAGAQIKRRRARHHVLRCARKAMRIETWKRLFRGEVNLNMVAQTISGDRDDASGRNLKDSERDLMAAFAGFRGRALFITGSRDPEGMAGREIFMPFCGRHNINAEFRLIEGANHSWYEPAHADDVVRQTTDWLLSGTRADSTGEASSR